MYLQMYLHFVLLYCVSDIWSRKIYQMSKYIQKVIPSVTIPEEWYGRKTQEYRIAVLNKIRNEFAGKEVENLDTKIKIKITVKSAKKTAIGEAMYPKKMAVVSVLPELLKYAKYNNWGKRKEKDNPEILGYLNFKAYCFIDGIKECVRLAIRFQKGGKFYYSLEVNKNPTTKRVV